MVNKEALEGMTAEQVMQLLQEVKERRRAAIALAESEKVVEQYYEEIGIIREFCEKVMQPWTEITAALQHSGEAVSRFYLDRARSHYDSER